MTAAETAFEPKNQLELSMVEAKSAQLPARALIGVFLATRLAVPTAKDPGQDGADFSPILYDKQDTSMLGVFSAAERIGELSRMAPYCVMMRGIDLVRRLPPDTGIVINPGLEVAFDISPEGVADILRDYPAP